MSVLAQLTETASLFERLGLPVGIIVVLVLGFAWRERVFNVFCERQEKRMDDKDESCKQERRELADTFTKALGEHTATLKELVRQNDRRA